MPVTIGMMIISFLFLRETALLPDGKLHLHILDVGQGDSILLITPSGKQVLVDGGPDLSTLSHLERFIPFFDRTIELVILTHPDSDHVTALPSVLERYGVNHVLMTGVHHASGRYAALQSGISAQSISVLFPDPSMDIDLGDGVVLDVVWPSKNLISVTPKNQNSASVVVRVLYKGHAILLPGDIEIEAEHEILASGANIRSSILKVPHHGSRTSSSTGFLLAVAPDIGLISAGKDNRFGHPHRDVVDRYSAFGIPTKTTAHDGVISLEF